MCRMTWQATSEPRCTQANMCKSVGSSFGGFWPHQPKSQSKMPVLANAPVDRNATLRKFETKNVLSELRFLAPMRCFLV
jgi:hypothetical protein